MPHAPPISFFSIWSPRIMLVEDHRPYSRSLCSILHCLVTSSLLGPMSCSASYFRTPSAYQQYTYKQTKHNYLTRREKAERIWQIYSN
jgi:hypothetical protein